MGNYRVGGFYRFTRVYIFLIDGLVCAGGTASRLNAVLECFDGRARIPLPFVLNPHLPVNSDSRQTAGVEV